MANVDRPRGAAPVNRDGSAYNGSLRRGDVDAANATAIYIGDFVVQEADGNYTPATAGATNVIAGVVVGVTVDRDVLATEHPGYLPALTAGSILIAPAEASYFRIQEDGEVSQLAATDRGARVNFTAGAGNATTGRSTHEIDSDSVGNVGTEQLQLVELIRDPDNEYGQYAEWVVRVNLPQHAVSTAGI